MTSSNPGQQTQHVADGDSVNVTCQVDGGFPRMTSHDVSVVCGNSSGQGEVYLPVVSVSQSPVTCVCKAMDQEASCYFKTSNVSFDVTGEWNYIIVSHLGETTHKPLYS